MVGYKKAAEVGINVSPSLLNTGTCLTFARTQSSENESRSGDAAPLGPVMWIGTTINGKQWDDY